MEPTYAGFWRRGAAMVIDLLILVLCAVVHEVSLLFIHFAGNIGFQTLTFLARAADTFSSGSTSP